MREIPNIARFTDKHLDELLGKFIIEHNFKYRAGQPEYLVFVHFDEFEKR